MKKKQSRAKSYAYYLKETGLLNSIGGKRWNEFLDDVYNTLEKSIYRPSLKMMKSKSEGDLCVVGVSKMEGKIESKLVYNKEISSVGVRNSLIRENVHKKDLFEDMHKKNTVKDMKTPIINQNIITKDITKDNPLFNTPPSPLNEKRPDESYYNNGYVQSIGHSFIPLKHPPSPNSNTPYLFKPKINKKEIDLRIQAALGLIKLRNVKKE